MNILKHIFFILLLLYGITTYAQKVSNITYRQEQSNIIVSYDLETKSPCKVSLYVSTNGGEKWQGPLTKVTGDVGSKVVSGSKNITWNVLEEFEELRGDKIMFQVRTVGDNIETVMIGSQEWSVYNLNVSKYRNGDVIPEVKDYKEWVNLTTGAWCYYNNDPKNGAIYGKLYNWYAVDDPRGLAPKGFHISSDSELNNVTDLKGIDGFAGLPGGYRVNDGKFTSVGNFGFWWSSTHGDTTGAWNRCLNYTNGNAARNIYHEEYGFSVRCLRD
jgi:hypothetical protein